MEIVIRDTGWATYVMGSALLLLVIAWSAWSLGRAVRGVVEIRAAGLSIGGRGKTMPLLRLATTLLVALVYAVLLLVFGGIFVSLVILEGVNSVSFDASAMTLHYRWHDRAVPYEDVRHISIASRTASWLGLQVRGSRQQRVLSISTRTDDYVIDPRKSAYNPIVERICGEVSRRAPRATVDRARASVSIPRSTPD